MIYKDNKGREFNTLKDMAKANGIKLHTLYRRMVNNPFDEWFIHGNLKKSRVRDHLGNLFNSEKELCEHYNISYSFFRSRKRKGFTNTEILTSSMSGFIVDHLGNKYNNVRELCKQYGISIWAYYYRISHGYSLRKTLLTETRKINRNM